MKKGIYITLDIEKLPEDYYVATSRDVQGLVAQAKTFEKTIEMPEDVPHTFPSTKRKLNKRKSIHVSYDVPCITDFF